jgi:hypothetical protein
MTASRYHLMLWFFFLLIVPIYVFGKDPVLKRDDPKQVAAFKVEGGMPQPADFFMVVFMGALVASVGVRLEPWAVRVVVPFAAFAVYAALVGLFWGAWLDDVAPVKGMVFYPYDCMIFLTFLILYCRYKEDLLRWTVHGVAAAVFLLVALAPLTYDASIDRQNLSFNNCNQLGYFGVMAATIFFLGSKYFRIGVAYQICFYLAVTFVTLITLSKTAIGALGLLFVLLLLRRPMLLLVGGLLLGIGFLVALSLPPSQKPWVVASVEARFAREGNDETAERRGYDRIWNHPEHTLFGAGEGVTYRFQSEWPGELHSSWGTILFSYGVVGVLLFGCGVWRGLRGNGRLAIYCMPVFLFGCIHQGLRLTMFWVLMAFVFCLARSCEVGFAHRAVPRGAAEEAVPRGLALGHGL